MTPASVQGHDDRDGSDSQTTETEGAAAYKNTIQHVSSDTIKNTEDLTHQLPRPTLEP